MRSGGRRQPSLGQRRGPARDESRRSRQQWRCCSGARRTSESWTDKSTSVVLHDGLTVSAPTTAATPRSLPPPLLSSRANPPGTPYDEN